MSSKLSIIIVSYNVKELLLKCIGSVQASALENCEVIVVDNNSADESVAAVKNAFPTVILIENKNNVGFSAANNQGMAIAGGDIIFLLNPDTEVKEGAILKMMNYLSGKKEQIILAPQLLNSDGSIQPSAWWFPTLTEVFCRAVFLNKVLCLEEYAPEHFNSSFPADGLSGAALMFTKETLAQIGTMDEHLFWMDDIDLCYRNVKAGGKNIYFRPAQVIHHSGKSTKKNLRIPISNQLISKLKFFRKHKGVFVMSIASIFVFIHIILRLILFLVPSLALKSVRIKLDAYFYSFKKLFRYLFAGDKSVI